jgi:hypothetical protein
VGEFTRSIPSSHDSLATAGAAVDLERRSNRHFAAAFSAPECLAKLGISNVIKIRKFQKAAAKLGGNSK